MNRALGNDSAKLVEPVEAAISGKGKGGLSTEIHPLLRGISTPIIPSGHNPLKRKARDQFDPLSLNPYLTQSTGSLLPQRKHRPFQLTQPGTYIAHAEKIRSHAEAEAQRRLEFEDTRSRGHTPNISIGEDLFKSEPPPPIEWWDRPYLKDSDYSNVGDPQRIITDSDEQPVTIYIHHPVILSPLWEKHEPEARALMLTKSERKRLRRNERQRKLKDHQDRIKLGLEPPAPPKVKLSNLMSVLATEAIKDPTEIEKQVRAQVQERLDKHLAANAARIPSKEDKLESIKNRHERQLQAGFFCNVYCVNKLGSQHLFKVDINAKQLGLVGMCITNPLFCLIIVNGSENATRYYHKLLTKRVNWTLNVPQETEETGHATKTVYNWENNRCRTIWTGQVKDIQFKKWSVIDTANDDEALSLLQRFGIENYWREALVVKE